MERHLAFALVAYKDIAGHQDYWDIAPGYMLLQVEFVAPLEGMSWEIVQHANSLLAVYFGREMMAVAADSANARSVDLHAKEVDTGKVYAQVAEMHPESHPVPIFCYPVGPVEGKRIVLLVQLDHLDDNMVRLASLSFSN